MIYFVGFKLFYNRICLNNRLIKHQSEITGIEESEKLGNDHEEDKDFTNVSTSVLLQ